MALRRDRKSLCSQLFDGLRASSGKRHNDARMTDTRAAGRPTTLVGCRHSVSRSLTTVSRGNLTPIGRRRLRPEREWRPRRSAARRLSQFQNDRLRCDIDIVIHARRSPGRIWRRFSCARTSR
jgi:hypothetical protein